MYVRVHYGSNIHFLAVNFICFNRFNTKIWVHSCVFFDAFHSVHQLFFHLEFCLQLILTAHIVDVAVINVLSFALISFSFFQVQF